MQNNHSSNISQKRINNTNKKLNQDIRRFPSYVSSRTIVTGIISEIIEKTVIESTKPSQNVYNNSSTEIVNSVHLNESTNTLDDTRMNLVTL